jgi:hypothetical protein
MIGNFVSINYAAEESIVDYLIGSCDPLQTTASYYTGLGNIEELEAPAVVISADNGTETHPYSNVYDLTIQIAVKEMAADMSGSISGMNNPPLGKLSANIFNAICNPNMKGCLNSSSISHSFVSQFIQKLDAKHSVSKDVLLSDYTIRVIGAISGSLSQSPLPTE